MVTKVEENRYSNKDVNITGENLMKHDWARSCGMNLPRMRRPEDSSAAAGLIMEWASVASWFLKPDTNLLSTTCSTNNSITNSPSNNSRKNNCRIPSDIPVPLGPTICTAIRCTVPGCDCECFIPGKLHVRYCESCKHSWVPHALDKLGFRHIFGQAPVEPVQSNVVFDIASLVLYGCQALPIRLKILLDRLFSVLQKDEVTQILRGFGWSHEDYVRGYILQEAHGNVLDHWNICTPEEEPLVLQQFLRFGETRTITQQLLMHGLGDLRHLPRSDSDFKKMVEKGITKGLSSNKTLEESNRSGNKYSSNNLSSSSTQKLRNLSSPPTNVTSPLLPPPPHISGKYPSLLAPPSHPGATPLSISPQQPLVPPPPPPPPPSKHSSLNFVKLPQTGLTCTPITTTTPVSSPLNNALSTTSVNMSPLNKLQKMQPFDFRQIASGIFQSSKPSSERRRASETSDTSQSGLNLCVTSPSTLLTHPPIPMPPVSVAPYSASSVSCKSPVIDFSASKNSSEFDSEDGYEEEEESAQNALNLSKDASPRSMKQRHGHSRKASTPIKRQWGSSNLPLNLGTQLINPATGKKRVQCNVCLKTFCDKGALKIHFSAVHLREMHKCTVEGCNMMFSSRRSRNRHSANPNPKLHSPHLRRKISPHDGRSAQAHPILIPPLQAGLNPLTFGTFPLLTPPDLRHSLSGLDLKQGFDFNNIKDSIKFEESMDTQDGYIDYDDEDGIIVDDAGVDDDENDSETNSGEKIESIRSKRIKMLESDVDEDGASNTDSNESMTLSDHQPLKEENDLRSRNSRKRKSQKPTRCPMRAVSTDDEQLSDAYSDEMIFSAGTQPGNGNDSSQMETEAPKLEQEKEWDLSKSAIKMDENSTPFPSAQEQQEAECSFAKVKHETSDQQEEEKQEKQEEEQQQHEKLMPDECLNLCKNNELNREVLGKHETSERIPIEDEDVLNEGDETVEDEPLNFAGDATAFSPAQSHGSDDLSTASCDSDENSYGQDEDGNTSDVPLDKDNPRKCTACGKVFQNHFGVKTHFQNVHLKLMHKCVVDGCNAAFPSKRSRDRHSGNENLHRKLLSTSDSSVPSFGPPSSLESQTFNSPPLPLQPQPNMPNDFLSRLYGESQNLPLTAASPKTTNGELIVSHPPLMIPPLAGLPFTGLSPYTPSHLSPVLNGKTTENLSPSKSPHLLIYNVEEDIPTPDQDNVFHCRFCSKPFAELITLKEHYERNHLNEMFRCNIPGCLQVFSSRTKRNLHSQNRLLHAKEISAS